MSRCDEGSDLPPLSPVDLHLPRFVGDLWGDSGGNLASPTAPDVSAPSRAPRNLNEPQSCHGQRMARSTRTQSIRAHREAAQRRSVFSRRRHRSLTGARWAFLDDTHRARISPAERRRTRVESLAVGTGPASLVAPFRSPVDFDDGGPLGRLSAGRARVQLRRDRTGGGCSTSVDTTVTVERNDTIGRSPRPDYGWCDGSLIEKIRASSGIEDPNLIFAGQYSFACPTDAATVAARPWARGRHVGGPHRGVRRHVLGHLDRPLWRASRRPTWCGRRPSTTISRIRRHRRRHADHPAAARRLARRAGGPEPPVVRSRRPSPRGEPAPVVAEAAPSAASPDHSRSGRVAADAEVPAPIAP